MTVYAHSHSAYAVITVAGGRGCFLRVLTGPAPDGGGMALIPLAGRGHVLGQLFDVLAQYGGKASLQVRQFLVRQENILVTAIGAGGASLLYLCLLYTSRCV